MVLSSAFEPNHFRLATAWILMASSNVTFMARPRIDRRNFVTWVGVHCDGLFQNDAGMGLKRNWPINSKWATPSARSWRLTVAARLLLSLFNAIVQGRPP
jgi:hypothetical protein